MDNEIQKQDEQVELLTGKDIPEEIRQKLPEGAVVRRVKRKKKSESETIREIRRETRNRSELAQLQRAKQGLAFQEEVLKDAPKEDFTPKTFRQKLANFWYHNKMWSGVFILIAVLLGMGIKGWFFPPKYDVDIVLASELPLESRDLVQPMNLYTEDFDQNGEQAVKLSCWHIVREDSVYTSTDHIMNLLNQFKLALAIGDYDPQLYILDEYNYRYMTDEVGIVFRDLSDLDKSGKITGDRVRLSDLPLYAHYDQFAPVLEELYICIYDTEQMKTNDKGKPIDKFLGKEKFVKHYDESLAYLTHLINGEEILLPAEK